MIFTFMACDKKILYRKLKKKGCCELLGAMKAFVVVLWLVGGVGEQEVVPFYSETRGTSKCVKFVLALLDSIGIFSPHWFQRVTC